MPPLFFCFRGGIKQDARLFTECYASPEGTLKTKPFFIARG
jgi:hypothetical protein